MTGLACIYSRTVPQPRYHLKAKTRTDSMAMAARALLAALRQQHRLARHDDRRLRPQRPQRGLLAGELAILIS